MSFLNSVLSSIGGDNQQQGLPPAQTLPSLKPQVSKQKADPTPIIITNKPNGVTSGQKRKADEPLPSPKAKAAKDEQGQRVADGMPRDGGRLPLKGATRPTISTSKSVLAVPYRGTGRPSPTSASPNTPTTDPSKNAPKKGSYAEIMARASANNNSSVGVIKHKPKDAISAKKEILMRKKGILPKIPIGTKDGRNEASIKDRNSPLLSPAKLKSPALPGKKPPQPSYKGTVAPKPQPAYKGTIKPKSSIADTARRKGPRDIRSRSNSVNAPRRRHDHDSDDGGDEEEERGIYSDESDDMEAGFSDVEEEETAALRAAKKDDEEELKLENKLKKEKEERKQKLAAMAAKAPKPRY